MTKKNESEDRKVCPVFWAFCSLHSVAITLGYFSNTFLLKWRKVGISIWSCERVSLSWDIFPTGEKMLSGEVEDAGIHRKDQEHWALQLLCWSCHTHTCPKRIFARESLKKEVFIKPQVCFSELHKPCILTLFVRRIQKVYKSHGILFHSCVWGAMRG